MKRKTKQDEEKERIRRRRTTGFHNGATLQASTRRDLDLPGSLHTKEDRKLRCTEREGELEVRVC